MNIIQVIVVYALPDIQYFFKVNTKIGATVKDVILKSNVLISVNNLSLYSLKVGIYNKLVSLNSTIQDGDRIEIYRNLIIDPKERRIKKHKLFKKQ
ncbi:MAG: RnfH family protein [Buchnera aphidicola (Brevicoryne brassicae)]|uniref:UPF0125 protein OW720_01305 n=1 Tax=Buchnera aphidicola (Brevicoryne brassicae) TaxID=911343 RepID=A0AAJ5PUV9_9GAMM|nr:RnfH family protein [Buchnera aphidicola]QCI19820.1 RnfH family protein [Buchnera aphidicola (Brevicoryne brassicae)]WAI19194.1 MAG: RnfH family protein [Buchnera aphidicola (Brevicoryne brassicae)]